MSENIELRLNRAGPGGKLQHRCTACNRVMDVLGVDDLPDLERTVEGGQWHQQRLRCPGCGLEALFRLCM